jgi:hypothetical protein
MNYYDLLHLPQARFQYCICLTTQRLNSPCALKQSHEDVCNSGGKAPIIRNIVTGQLHAPADISCRLTTKINKLSTKEETSLTSHTALNHFSINIFQYKLNIFSKMCRQKTSPSSTEWHHRYFYLINFQTRYIGMVKGKEFEVIQCELPPIAQCSCQHSPKSVG